jgi:hypothetical protein
VGFGCFLAALGSGRFPFSLPANLVDHDALFVPHGSDSERLVQDLIISDDVSMASAIKTVAGFERLVPAPVHAAESLVCHIPLMCFFFARHG